jgi:hypothetical protein
MMSAPGPPPPEFDDRQPLAIGCLIALVAAAVLGSAFLLGAWSALRGPQTNVSAPPAETPAARP